MHCWRVRDMAGYTMRFTTVSPHDGQWFVVSHSWESERDGLWMRENWEESNPAQHNLKSFSLFTKLNALLHLFVFVLNYLPQSLCKHTIFWISFFVRHGGNIIVEPGISWLRRGWKAHHLFRVTPHPSSPSFPVILLSLPCVSSQ